MENNSFLETLASRLGQNATVKSVYGEPVTAQGKTIIPVAKIAMGLGGGYGHKNGKQQKPGTDAAQTEDNTGEGAGGGGGMFATPKGVYEVTGQCTRFIPANATKQFLMVAALAFLAGRWTGRSKRKKEKFEGHKA